NHIVPEEIRKIYMTFHNAEYKLYLVGGSVRAMILHKDKALENIKDWDLTTDATPEEMMKLFPNAFYDNSFGTVGLPIGSLKDVEHAGIVEITTFRTEKGYDDNRHPTEVSWGKTIEEDLARRDFTMNAIAIELTEDFKTNPIFIDPFDGQKDIKDKLIRAAGDPDHRFKGDALRLMRAIRFAAQLGFEIEEKTLTSI